MANLLSVNIGAAARLPVPGGRTVLSAIRKTPVEAPVVVGPLGLAGDEQADLSVHGGLQKAVYAYPAEHLAFWRAERARQGVVAADQPLPPGFMGENLTLTGLVEREAWIGDLLRFEGSDCVLRVTGPREPCGKLAAVMGVGVAGRLMVQRGISGFYLAVDAPGELAAGLAVHLEPGPRRLSVLDALRAKWAKHRD